MPRLPVLLFVALAAACGSTSISTITATSGAASSGTGSASSTGSTGASSGSTVGGGSTGKLADGADCNANAACQSKVCGLSGSGHCCTAQCRNLDSAICQATQCDSSGACDYAAAGTACGSTCTDAGFTSDACDGVGNCAGTETALCTGDFACADATTCKAACAGDGDCASGFYCQAGACLAQLAVGACSANDACVSGICGIGGSGHCCSVQCAGSDPVCSAPDCDALTGACQYADAGTACGAASESCSAETQLEPSTCDGKGSCPGSVTLCYPYACGPSACFQTCTSGAQCSSVNFCDVGDSACCPVLPLGGFIDVDAVTGSDKLACCGIGTAQPCASLTRAMEIIDEAGAADVRLTATINGVGGEWPASQETYPVVLGWGVELYAPGVDFTAVNGESEVFDVGPYSAKDTVGYASIVGTDAAPLQIGFNYPPTEISGIQVEAPYRLYLAGSQIASFIPDNGATNAILVEPGGAITFGQDRSSANSGTVDIGDPSGLLAGWNGVECMTAKGKGCSLTDAPLEESAVRFEGMQNNDLYLPAGSSASLMSAPVIGLPPTKVGFRQCPSKQDLAASGFFGSAVTLDGLSSLTFSNGTVQCLSGTAFALTGGDAGAPTLTLTKSTIQNTERGIYASDGTASLAASTFRYNYIGAWQDSSGNYGSTINLNGGDAGGNTVICNNAFESVTGGYLGTPGMGVINGVVATTLDADNVTWDTAGPDYFACDDLFQTCTCKLPSCSVTAGSNGMDAVEVVDGDSAAISTANPSQTKLSCATGQ